MDEKPIHITPDPQQVIEMIRADKHEVANLVLDKFEQRSLVQQLVPMMHGLIGQVEEKDQAIKDLEEKLAALEVKKP